MNNMNLIVDNPNFSIVVPSPCNASCNFCFWNRDYIEVDPKDYMIKLVKTLDNLPGEFTQCSITGGEPTTLPWLRGILTLARERFSKVVFTTNGHNLVNHTYMAEHGLIDHLNISRHAIGKEDNIKIFKDSRIPHDDEIEVMSTFFQYHGIDVSLNCVVSKDFRDVEFVYKYIQYAKDMNINSVAFRKDHSDLFDMGVEPFLGKIVDTAGCPACKVDARYIDGMLTYWKYSVEEPSNELGGVYELVYHPNGVVTSDWKGEHVVNII